MRKLMVTLAAFAVLAGGAGLAPGAASPDSSGIGPATRAADETIRVVEKGARSRFVDVGAKGESVGDMMLSRARLVRGGEQVGRVLTRCVLLFRPDLLCDGVYKLAGRGDIAFSNVVNTAKEPPLLGPIVGGDGEFANVGGQLRLRLRGGNAVTVLQIEHLD